MVFPGLYCVPRILSTVRSFNDSCCLGCGTCYFPSTPKVYHCCYYLQSVFLSYPGYISARQSNLTSGHRTIRNYVWTSRRGLTEAAASWSFLALFVRVAWSFMWSQAFVKVSIAGKHEWMLRCQKGWAAGDVLIAAQHTGRLTLSLADPAFSRDDNPVRPMHFVVHSSCEPQMIWAGQHILCHQLHSFPHGWLLCLGMVVLSNFQASDYRGTGQRRPKHLT